MWCPCLIKLLETDREEMSLEDNLYITQAACEHAAYTSTYQLTEYIVKITFVKMF